MLVLSLLDTCAIYVRFLCPVDNFLAKCPLLQCDHLSKCEKKRRIANANAPARRGKSSASSGDLTQGYYLKVNSEILIKAQIRLGFKMKSENIFKFKK